MAAPNLPNASGSALATRENILPATVETAAVAAAAQAKAAVESRYLMALQRPRDMVKVREKLLAACDRPGFAEDAKYRKPIGKTFVTGPSIRFAEEAARCLGNLLNDSTVVFDDEERRIIRMSVTDLESNLTYPYDVVVEKTIERKSVSSYDEVVSRRKNSKGELVFRIKANPDDVIIKQNALLSKAMRTNVLRLLASDLQEECMERVEVTLRKQSKNGAEIEKLMRAFQKLGVTEGAIQEYIGHTIDKMTPEEFANLRGIGLAIQDGETTWADVVGNKPEPEPRETQKGVRDPSDSYGMKEVKPEIRTVQPPPDRPMQADPYLSGQEPEK